MSIWKTACVAAAVGLAVPVAHAQAPAASSAAATTSASAPATASVVPPYRSAFEGYQRYSDQPVGSWKEANDNVGRIGGWRTYAKEATGEQASPHAGHGAAQPAAGQTPPRAGKANTETPFGQTEATNPPKTAPKPTPAPSPAPAASQPSSPAGHSKHH